MANFKNAKRVEMYGLTFLPHVDELARELYMCRNGGRWSYKGKIVGNGMFYHFKRLQELLYGKHKIWHRWNEQQTKLYCQYDFDYVPEGLDEFERRSFIAQHRAYRTIGAIGPKSSGKTNGASTDVLADYYVWPDCTTVLVTTTTRESLENRVWGELKKYHRIARRRWPQLPGHLIEGRQRIVTDAKDDEDEEGRDFRNGLMGLACKKGNEMVNMADFAGIKNARVRVLGDELSHFPKTFVDVIANLDSNPDFVFYGLGNPKDITDALGYLCEPAPHLGGWESGIDQKPGTKTWELKRPKGICIHLPGDDSPNLDGKMSIPLITKEMMDRDEKFYGKDSWQYQMMNLGRMPRGQGSRRVLTRQACIKFGAILEPFWRDTSRTLIASLDAAYRGVGGDRCVFAVQEFGEESENVPVRSINSPFAQPLPPYVKNRQILSLVDVVTIPIQDGEDLPEDQIVRFVRNQCMARGIPPNNFFYDAGMRTSLVSAFSRLWSVDCETVDCGGRPTDNDVSREINVPCSTYYANFISELWYQVRTIVESGQFRGMTEDVMWEFCIREFMVTMGNKIQVEPKEKMKEKSGRSPDLADCVAIGCWGATRRGFVISKLGNRESSASAVSFLRKWRERARSSWKAGQLQTA